MIQKLYVFDMDDTLLDGDCSMIWNEYLVDQGIVMQPEFLERDRALMQRYSQGRMSIEEYLAFSLQPLERYSTEQIKAWVIACVNERILPRIYPQARALIQDLQQIDAPMLVISASVHFLVEPIAQALGINHALGIDLLEARGKITPKIRGIASYREGKVQRLEQWLTERSLDREQLEIHFYTDSINDLPLCQYADQVHLVNPCPLLTQAAHSSWQHYRW